MLRDLYIEHSLRHKTPRQNLFFHVLLPVIFSRKNIQSNFTLVLPSKKFEMAIAVENYIKQYQLNLSYIEESHINFR